jgi:hypothetical protein
MIWYLEKGIKPNRPVKRAMEDEMEGGDEAISGQVQMLSNSRFYVISYQAK